MLERAGAHGFSYELHGGPPIRMQWHFYGQSELPVAVQTWELPPGGFEGMHTHAAPDGALEEIYVVIEGTGRMEIDGETFEISAGDSVLARPGTAHDLRNTGDGSLKVLTIWGPPGRADFSGFGSARRAAAARASEAR